MLNRKRLKSLFYQRAALGDSFQLLEHLAPYGEHIGVKNEGIGLENTYLCNVKKQSTT